MRTNCVINIMADIVVDIYLNISGSGALFPFISTIPYSDIQRPSVWASKRLQYIMFCICGPHSDLSETPGNLLLTMIEPHWLMFHAIIILHVNFLIACEIVAPCIPISPAKHCIFENFDGLDDQVISTRHTTSSNNF